MKITAIAPWFGGKRSLAHRIVAEFGPHRAYWEPFCGSMAVLLAKPEVSQETVNDLHGDLINLARVIRHERWGPWLYRQLRRFLAHEESYRSAAAVMKEDRNWFVPEDDSSPCLGSAVRARDFFVSSWLGRNGVIGTKGWNNNFCVRYTSDGGIQGTRFAAAVDSIPAWRRRMREVTILRRNGLDLIDRIEDKAGTVVYCDPPYLVKGAEYQHDFEAEDHQRLAGLLRRFSKTRVVVSYYAHPLLESLYPGWTVVDCEVSKSLVAQGRRGKDNKVKAPEVLLINGNAYTSDVADLEEAGPAGLF